MNAADNQVGGDSPPRTAAALAFSAVAVFLVLVTGLITFGLAQGYGFGPVWDRSAFVMTAAVAVLVGAAVLGAVRLARLRMRALPVLAASVACVFAVGYVAGVLGNGMHH